MSKGKHERQIQLPANKILFWAVGVLLVVTVLSMWLASGLFAKYVTSGSAGDRARAAGTGQAKVELREHEANEAIGYPDANGGEYRLDLTKEVTENKYEKVLPGVDIPKDPFVRLEIDNAEVDYELYIKVTESDPFPEYVTYEVRDDLWTPVASESTDNESVYKFNTYLEAGRKYAYTGLKTIPILKDNRLYVSEHYVGTDADGNSVEFSLSFEAWLKQVD